MKTKADIFTTLKNLFIASQNEIQEIREGSVVSGLLHSISTEVANVYETINSGLNNLYIDKATGDYLDAIIEGFTGLKRKQATRSVGYVLIELGEPIDNTNLNKLSFSFSRYDYSNDYLENDFSGTVTFLVATQPGEQLNLSIIQPQSIYTERTDFIPDPQTKLQPLFSQYRDFIRIVYSTTGKPVRYLILPVATIETSINTYLKTGAIDTFINIGVPARIVNLYLKTNANLSEYSVVDIDGIAKINQPPYQDAIQLGEFSNIKGGTDTETDEEYRSRYYLYMSSLSKGTASAIELGIANTFPSIDIRSISTNRPGEVDVVVYARKPVTPNIISSMSEALRDYRPVGIKLNIFTARTIPLTVLMDVTTPSFQTSVEKARNALGFILENKDIGEPLAYTDINEGLDMPEINFLDNIMYGMLVTKNLYDTYSATFNSVYQILMPSISPSYKTVYQTLVGSPALVELYNYTNGNTGYPLIEFVRAAKKVPDPTTLPSPLDTIVTRIQACPAGVRDVECLDTLSATSGNIVITLQDYINLMGQEAAVYYRIKLLTAPNINLLSSSVAEALIQEVLLNDVINLTYRATRPILLGEFEKIILSTDSTLSAGSFKSPETVGMRVHEPIG